VPAIRFEHASGAAGWIEVEKVLLAAGGGGGFRQGAAQVAARTAMATMNGGNEI
jgi:hypothetical protein